MGWSGAILLTLMGATVLVMLFGIGFMLKGGEQNSRRSNKMMVLRVSFQALVLAFLFILYLTKR